MQSFCKNLSISVVLVAGHMVQVSGQQPTPASGRIDFDRDIRPILSDKCFVCHGPDAVNNKSKLRFDTEAHAFADFGNGRRAIVRWRSETESTGAAHHGRESRAPYAARLLRAETDPSRRSTG